MRADDDCRRRLIEMKKPVNIRFSGFDCLHVADREKVSRFQIQISDLGKSIYLFARLKLEPTMQTRTHQNLKRAAESVLMNRGRAFEPEINVNVKARAVVERDRRIAEFSGKIALFGQIRLIHRPFDNFPRRNFFRQIRFAQSVSRNLREKRFVVIFPAPDFFDRCAEMLKKFHKKILAEILRSAQAAA